MVHLLRFLGEPTSWCRVVDACFRTTERNGFYIIRPILPELRKEEIRTPALSGEYSSANVTLDCDQLRSLLATFTESERKGVPA